MNAGAGESGDSDRIAAAEALVPDPVSFVDHTLPPVSVARVGGLAKDLLVKASGSSNVDEIDSAIHLLRRILQAISVENVERAKYFNNLGIALQMRFERTGATSDLDEAVEVGRQAAAATSPDHFDRAVCLNTLGNALWTRFSRAGTNADLDETIDMARQIVHASTPDHPEYLRYLNTLWITLQRRFERTGATTDLDEAIEVARQSIDAASGDHPNLARYLEALDIALRTRFERFGTTADLDEAVGVARRAVRATRPDDVDLAERLSNLGTALWTRFECTGVAGDLDEAVEATRRATRGIPTGHPHYATSLNILGVVLRARSEVTGTSSDTADLDEAIDAIRRAVQATTVGDPDHPKYLNNVGIALRARFERTGSTADLDEAVDVTRRAIQAVPPDHLDYAGYLNNLGIALRTRFELAGSTTDLDEAIEVTRRAVQTTPSTHSSHAARLNTLGMALHARADRTGASADLDEAIEATRRAVQTTLPDEPDHAGYLNNLAITLGKRFERTGAAADLDQAIETARRAVRITEPDRAAYAPQLNTLGIALRTRFERTGSEADLGEAIEVTRRVIQATPPDHPDNAGYLSNLAIALERRAQRAGSATDLDEAVIALEQAAGLAVAAPSIRIRAAVTAARILGSSQPHRGRSVLEQAILLLPQIAPRQLPRPDQQDALSQYDGLAADAAALTLADHRLPADRRASKALQLLEAGRAVLLGQALQVRTDLTELTDLHPKLAAEFVRLRDLLDRPTGNNAPPLPWQASVPMPDRHRLAREFETVIARIRAQPEFGTFAFPPDIGELRAQAADGSLVVFNISQYRCDALLVTSDLVTCLPLPGLTRDSVTDHAATFQRSLHDLGEASTWRAHDVAQRRLHRVLEWLWDNVTGPVLHALGHRRALAPDQPGQRIWWIPTGPLTELPIHASGYHTNPPAPEAHSVLDRVVSSYTPTITSLRYARRRSSTATSTNEQPSAVIVAMPTTPGIPGRLGGVHEEIRVLKSHVPDAITLAEPDSPSAGDLPDTVPTRANVVRLLGECAIAHFACHGLSDPADPSRSRLLLHDHATDPLTVAALAPVHLDHAHLAYLSACQTATTTHSELLDEAIHLTSAFQLAGYPHVIGTLWPVNDHVAVRIAGNFYAALTNDKGAPAFEQAAYALHRAIRIERDFRPTAPSFWAAHLHSGA